MPPSASALSPTRFVALGDSQTEGLHDYYDDGTPRGWADRFAEQLAQRQPDLRYANLAVRGKRTKQVLEDQLEAALALSPDLATVVSGVNDVVRPGTDIDDVACDLETMYRELRSAGCFVMGCTFPLPTVGLTARFASPLQQLNAAIRRAAARQEVLIVEIESIPSAADLRLWNPDRIHLNPEGHRLLAAVFEGTFSHRTSGEWTEPLPAAPPVSRIRELGAEARWVASFLVPKLIRTLRRVSSGDGRSAKRPELTPVLGDATRAEHA